MSIGIELTMKSGKKEWYDPVDEEEFESMQTADQYIINNGYYVYEVDKSDVAELIKYELCPGCLFDVRSERHTKGCEYDD